MLLKLAASSLWNRRSTVLLTVFTVSISIFVLLSVEQIRQQSRDSFARSVSGVDLIVGGRTGQLNLLLYSVFRLGNASNNISWRSYQMLADDKRIAWAIPLSLGDSHRGYRVMGTTDDYFTHFRYGNDQTLAFSQGNAFNDLYQVVLGAEVARKLGYSPGEKIILTHGLVATRHTQHDDKPFVVVGILKATGTPADQTLHVSLQSIEAIHKGWESGVRLPGAASHNLAAQDLTPKTITAVMLGLDNPMVTFALQRQINNYRGEALSAILPGAALSELWRISGNVEQLLRVIASLVLLAALSGMAAMLLASMNERRRELTVLRLIGASPVFVFFLIQCEALLISLVSLLLGIALTDLSLWLAADYLLENYGIVTGGQLLSTDVLVLAGVVIGLTWVMALWPAVSAYRRSLVVGD